jgi:hypothetical protein
MAHFGNKSKSDVYIMSLFLFIFASTVVAATLTRARTSVTLLAYHYLIKQFISLEKVQKAVNYSGFGV